MLRSNCAPRQSPGRLVLPSLGIWGLMPGKLQPRVGIGPLGRQLLPKIGTRSLPGFLLEIGVFGRFPVKSNYCENKKAVKCLIGIKILMLIEF